MQTSCKARALHSVLDSMGCDQILILNKLVNGVLTGEERADVLRWSAQFANTSMANRAHHLHMRNRTEKCSVCAFVSRCGVIDVSLKISVHMLDIALHKMGVHLHVNWTIICILGGLLLDLYFSSVGADFDDWFLQPGDLVHHYMISSDCIYEQDGPMVALRHACSHLTENMPITNGIDTADQMDEEDEECVEMGSSDIDGDEQEGQRKVPSTQANGAKIIDCIISMITRSDVSCGQCEDMTYTDMGGVTRADAMHIPSSVMLGRGISDRINEQECGNMNQETTTIESHDNLYAIYRDLAALSEGGENVSRQCMLMQEDADGRSPDKAEPLMKESYEWMKSMASCCYVTTI